MVFHNYHFIIRIVQLNIMWLYFIYHCFIFTFSINYIRVFAYLDDNQKT